MTTSGWSSSTSWESTGPRSAFPRSWPWRGPGLGTSCPGVEPLFPPAEEAPEGAEAQGEKEEAQGPQEEAQNPQEEKGRGPKPHRHQGSEGRLLLQGRAGLEVEPGHPEDGEEEEGRVRGRGQKGGEEEEEAPLSPRRKRP